MAYTNSSLVTYKNITKNKTSPRNHKIDTITIHCYVGQVTAKQGCDYFATTNRQCSSNYVVGYDGSIGLSVDEKDRSWCTNSASNDNRAITIEVACEPAHPYTVTDKALSALIDLIADICKRNNIKELKWKGDKSLIGQIDKQNMTVHRWYAAKACPGDYLYNKHPYIVEQVNKKLAPPICNGKITGYNTIRYTDYLVVYNKGINTGTNIWGAEVAVDSSGVAICEPVYGKGKMSIPSGGYVISGHGIASTWILENIKKGSQITISNDTIKVGEVVKFNGKITGYNTIRYTDYLVIYNKGTNTGTNIWGAEVAVNADGVAICAPTYGKGNMAIPSGGYVISGHGVASDWIIKNIKKGSKITISNGVVKVGAVVPITNVSSKLNEGDKVKLVSGAKYTSGDTIPSWLFNTTLYLRDKQGENAVISTLKTGAVTGVVSMKYLKKA